MFDDVQIGVSKHAIERFRERIDPTAKASNIIDYLRRSTLPHHIQTTMRTYGYTLCQYLTIQNTLHFRYEHVTFVVRKKVHKGAKQICVVTCF